MPILLIIALLMAGPAWAQGKPEGLPPQTLQERMLQAEDARPSTDQGLAPLREGLTGTGRRTAIRAIGRLERVDLIPLIAPALADGVGIRAEAANALAQMAKTPAAVVEVQRLLIDRAAVDAGLNTWESWGEIAAALGRLQYDTIDQVSQAEAVLAQGLPAPDSFNDVDAAALSGPRAASSLWCEWRGRGSSAPCRRGRGICCDGQPPRSGRPPIHGRSSRAGWRWRRWSPGRKPPHR